jgi:hypothetical protein
LVLLQENYVSTASSIDVYKKYKLWVIVSVWICKSTVCQDYQL